MTHQTGHNFFILMCNTKVIYSKNKKSTLWVFLSNISYAYFPKALRRIVRKCPDYRQCKAKGTIAAELSLQ